jgi:hypothetical protein
MISLSLVFYSGNSLMISGLRANIPQYVPTKSIFSFVSVVRICADSNRPCQWCKCRVLFAFREIFDGIPDRFPASYKLIMSKQKSESVCPLGVTSFRLLNAQAQTSLQFLVYG